MRLAYNGLLWWIDRWRKSSAYAEMTVEEQGAYRNLLDAATLRGGPLPDDENVLAKACGDPRIWKRVRPKVITHFKLGPDGWRNETLDEVIKKTATLHEIRSEAGQAGAAKRWGKRAASR
jgi:uncharacterized protein YdaU (DUF1376 family)